MQNFGQHIHILSFFSIKVREGQTEEERGKDSREEKEKELQR